MTTLRPTWPTPFGRDVVPHDPPSGGRGSAPEPGRLRDAQQLGASRRTPEATRPHPPGPGRSNVRAVVGDEYRREAQLGAWWALRNQPAAVVVTVTEVAVTEVDTGIGDVYEAAARAVWQAPKVRARLHQHPQVGQPSRLCRALATACPRRPRRCSLPLT
jgi:hypothetical protein